MLTITMINEATTEMINDLNREFANKPFEYIKVFLKYSNRHKAINQWRLDLIDAISDE